jgi:hypothetical protein
MLQKFSGGVIMGHHEPLLAVRRKAQELLTRLKVNPNPLCSIAKFVKVKTQFIILGFVQTLRRDNDGATC